MKGLPCLLEEIMTNTWIQKRMNITGA